MAKSGKKIASPTKKRRGPMKKEVAIKSLSAKVGQKGQQAAAKFLKDYPADVVRLAFRLLPPASSTSKRDEARIAKLEKKDPKEAESLRALLKKSAS